MRRVASEGCGYFGIAIWRPKTAVNVGTLWRSAWLNDAAFLGTIGARYTRQPSDTVGTPNHVPLIHYSDIDDLINHLPYGCPLIGVELDGRAKPLPEFSHPPRAVYLLGAEDHGIPPRILDRCHYVVQIPTVREWSMNVAVAGAIIMYDRLAKTLPAL
jgi:tRNA G18 (ribose-2'-O)-methylase SpoU